VRATRGLRRIAVAATLATLFVSCAAAIATAQDRGSSSGDPVTVLPYGSTFLYAQVDSGAGEGFQAPAFDASGWAQGPAPFGGGSGYSCPDYDHQTNWDSNTDLLLRKNLTVPSHAYNVTVHVEVDNGAQVFWDGVDVSGGVQNHELCATPDDVGPFAVPDSLLTHPKEPYVLAIRAVDNGILTLFNASVTYDCQWSGPPWVSKFPNSTSLATLSGGFRNNVDRFVEAMRNAGIAVRVIATRRPLQRAYMMHYSWEIWRHDILSTSVPDFQPSNGQPGVDICWTHYKTGGVTNTRASFDAAEQMVHAFGISPKLQIPPALKSRHTEGLAIDMATTWSKPSVTIINGAGRPVTINTKPKDGLNEQLIAVGRTYGVIHFRNAEKDPTHWSNDGK
jgi:hypothetical protein